MAKPEIIITIVDTSGLYFNKVQISDSSAGLKGTCL